MHRRRCTQSSSIFRHSSQPSERRLMGFTSFRCLQAMGSSVSGQAGSFGEDAVYELHADGALADGGCDAFHAASANVPDCKDSRDARLEEERRTWQWPPAEILVIQVGPGLDEALVIERHGALQPFRVRTRAGHREEVADWQRFGLVRPCVAD